MRVSFLGKGGSGKTTMSTSFIKYLERKEKQVLAIDADTNVHLGDALGLSAPALSDNFSDVIQYLEPQKVKNNIPIFGAFPANSESTFIMPDFKDKFFKRFGAVKKNLALLTVGSYSEEGIGASCFHEKLGSIVLVIIR